jgi:hypothetical protein
VGLGFVTARAQHAGRGQLGQEALDERRLADAGLAVHDQDLRVPARGLGERIVKRSELALPAHEDGRRRDRHENNSYTTRVARSADRLLAVEVVAALAASRLVVAGLTGPGERVL